MATNVTVISEYRIDDYFDERQSGGDIFIYTSGGGAFFDPSLYYNKTDSDSRFVNVTGAESIAGVKTFSSTPIFSAGISVTGAVIATGEVESFDTSDIRLKERIQDLDGKKTLSALMKWRAVRYFHKLKKKLKIGLIAQEVQKDFPEVVKADPDGYLMINYGNLVPALLVAIQEQQSQIDELKEIVKRGTGSK